MTETRNKIDPEGAEISYGLFMDLLKAFKKSKYLTMAYDSKNPVFNVLYGIAAFNAVILKSMGKSIENDKKISDFFVQELLPSAFEITEDIITKAATDEDMTSIN